MDKATKERIKELKAKKQYDEIFIEFGKKAYKKHTPFIHRHKELKKLKQERKYEDIYNKYGEDVYNNSLAKAMYYEIKEANGAGKAFLWKMGVNLRKMGFVSAFYFLGITAALANGIEQTIEENAIKYESEIEDYNEKISEYADKVNAMNLEDIQVFMKVMDDMWENIQGYAEPKKDISGFLELDLATEDGYGVCRNMASDVAKKLNKINPEYNARIIPVWADANGSYQCANIQTKHPNIESNEGSNEATNSENQSEDSPIINMVQDALGNHMVTLVDVIEDKITLVLDPTNPGIGIYKNGKIEMFNSVGENGLEVRAKEYSNITIVQGGWEGTKDTVEGFVKSFKKSELTEEELENKYGIEAQNRALEEVRQKKKSWINLSFKDSIKVDVSQQKLSQREERETEPNMQKTTDNRKEYDENEIE